MLMQKLMQYRQYCESQYDASSRLFSMFRPRFDYAAKISAINKILVDHDGGNVNYTERDLGVLREGKLSSLLEIHKDQVPRVLREEFQSIQELCRLG